MTRLLVIFVAGAAARVAMPTTAQSSSASSMPERLPGKRRVLMLISDTGGGHRASANALDQMMQEIRADEDDTDVRVVDIWTEYARWPHATLPSSRPSKRSVRRHREGPARRRPHRQRGLR